VDYILAWSIMSLSESARMDVRRAHSQQVSNVTGMRTQVLVIVSIWRQVKQCFASYALRPFSGLVTVWWSQLLASSESMQLIRHTCYSIFQNLLWKYYPLSIETITGGIPFVDKMVLVQRMGLCWGKQLRISDLPNQYNLPVLFE